MPSIDDPFSKNAAGSVIWHMDKPTAQNNHRLCPIGNCAVQHFSLSVSLRMCEKPKFINARNGFPGTLMVETFILKKPALENQIS